MYRRHGTDFVVGLFIIVAVIAFIVLAFKVSGLTSWTNGSMYKITAEFSNIGDLKVRAPVTIAGVRIGQISDITLDHKTFQAVVTMKIEKGANDIPEDSTASILTAGLLGANYIEITPGFEKEYLKNGGKIEKTNQAMILQNLIGQLVFSMNNDKGKKK